MIEGTVLNGPHEGFEFAVETIEQGGTIVADGVVTEVVTPPKPAASQPTPADSSAVVATPEPSSPATSAVVPDLKPAVPAASDVQPTVAIDETVKETVPQPEPVVEPTPEPAPAPEEPAVTSEPAVMPSDAPPPPPEPAPPTPSAEPNLFEEVDAEPAAGAAAPETPPGPVDDAATGRDPLDTAVPAASEPADDSVPTPPANPLDDAALRSGEPARLWVDATGRHSVVGVLVDVRGGGICVLDTGAGILEIRSADLRRRDRDYAATAAERLAARRGPAAAETAAR